MEAAAVPQGRALVGRWVRVWWVGERKPWFHGVVTGYNSDEIEHCVRYDDGDEEQENLQGTDPVRWGLWQNPAGWRAVVE